MGTLIIPFGDFTVYDAGGGSSTPSLWDMDFDRSSVSRPTLTRADFNAALSGIDTSGDPARQETTREFTNGLANQDFGDFISLPWIDDPGQLFGLLMGEDLTLIAIDIPRLFFQFTYSQYFPIFGPLGASITGKLWANIDFGPIGYDTRGLMDFYNSGWRNPATLFNGLFLSDTAAADGSGEDVPELTLGGGIEAAAEINLGVAKAGVAGGIYAEVDFEIPFERVPTLADELSDGVLQLNMGKFAGSRFEGDESDTAETFTVSGTAGDLSVTSFGVTQHYEGNKIIIIGGEGDDIIDLSGITDASITYEIEGGVGNDTIILNENAGAAIIKGGSGDDTIISGAGADMIWGEAGSDVINAGGGNDLIFADNGKISEERDVLTASAALTDGSDVIIGGAGDDVIIGGGGADRIGGDLDPNISWLSGGALADPDTGPAMTG